MNAPLLSDSGWLLVAALAFSGGFFLAVGIHTLTRRIDQQLIAAQRDYIAALERLIVLLASSKGGHQ